MVNNIYQSGYVFQKHFYIKNCSLTSRLIQMLRSISVFGFNIRWVNNQCAKSSSNVTCGQCGKLLTISHVVCVISLQTMSCVAIVASILINNNMYQVASDEWQYLEQWHVVYVARKQYICQASDGSNI